MSLDMYAKISAPYKRNLMASSKLLVVFLIKRYQQSTLLKRENHHGCFRMFGACSPSFLSVTMALQSTSYANFVLQYCANRQIFQFSPSQHGLCIKKDNNKVKYRHLIFCSLLVVPCYIFLILNDRNASFSPSDFCLNTVIFASINFPQPNMHTL